MTEKTYSKIVGFTSIYSLLILFLLLTLNIIDRYSNFATNGGYIRTMITLFIVHIMVNIYAVIFYNIGENDEID